MSLAAWAGVGQGLNAGLQNYLQIRQIQNQERRLQDQEESSRLAEERAVRGETRQAAQDVRQKTLDQIVLDNAKNQQTTFTQSQAKYKEMNDPIYNISEIVTTNFQTPEARQIIFDRARAEGFAPEDMISKTKIEEFKEKFMKDPEVKAAIFDDRRKSIDAKITKLQDLVIEGGTPLATAGVSAKIKELEAQKAKIDLQDELKQKEITRLQEERKLKATEKTAEKETVSNLPAMRNHLLAMPEGPAKEAYRAAIKAQEDFEIREKEVTGKATAEAYGARQDAAEKKAGIAAETARVNKFYPALRADLLDQRKRLLEENPDHPNIGVIDRALKSLPSHLETDLAAIKAGKDPAGVLALSQWLSTQNLGATVVPGQIPAAVTTKPTVTKPMVKNPLRPPVEGETYTGAKGTYRYSGGKWLLDTTKGR